MKKILLTLLAFVFFAPAAFAEDLEVFSYQKLKNVSKQDNPAGTNLTMGFTGDEVRFLVFVQNKTATTATYRLEDILPDGLIYQPKSTYRYQLGSGRSWQKIADLAGENIFPLQNHEITINPKIGFYFKFSVIVSDDIPANNLTLSNFVNIYSKTGRVLKQTVTKVLVPNSTVKQVEAQSLSVDDEDYINKVLEEEQRFIEQTFFELEAEGFEAELPQKEVLAVNAETENQNQNYEMLTKRQVILYIVAIIVLMSLLFILKKKYGYEE